MDFKECLEAEQQRACDDIREGWKPFVELDETAFCDIVNERRGKVQRLQLNFDNQKKTKSTSSRLYFEPALLAKVDRDTTYGDLIKLLNSGVRTFLIQLAFSTCKELEQTILAVRTAIANFSMSSIYNVPIGLAVEIKGDVVRTGRMRNNQSQAIEEGQLLVLTMDDSYRNSCFKEVVYVYNLWKYINHLMLDDILYLGEEEIKLRIVKIVNRHITCCIESGAEIKSFMEVIMPFKLPDFYEPSDDDSKDIRFARNNCADFLVVPLVRGKTWFKGFRNYLKNICDEFVIIGSIYCSSLTTPECELKKMYVACGGILIYDYFKRPKRCFEVTEDVKATIKILERYRVPIIALIPIKTLKHFILLQDHKMLKKINAMLLEKSEKTKNFPIIAKQLEPVPDNICKCKINPICMEDQKGTTHYGLINCIYYTLTCMKSRAIIATSVVDPFTIIEFSNPKIYCPVIAVVTNERMAKILNIRRNIKSLVYSPISQDATDSEKEIIKHSLDYGKHMKMLYTGDFVLTIVDNIINDCYTNKVQTICVPKERIYLEEETVKGSDQYHECP